MGKKDGYFLVKEFYPETGSLQRIKCLMCLSCRKGNYQGFIICK